MDRILLILGINPATILFADAFLDRFPVVGIIQQYSFFSFRDSVPPWYVPAGQIDMPHMLSLIQETKPDLIVSYGPSRLSEELISIARLGGINVHWGITPMYRGMHTARFALLQRAPEWVGLTIHKLEPTLDTGPIIYQAKPDLKVGDSAKMIEHRLNMLACEIMPYAVQEVLNGTANLVTQDVTKGREYKNKEWTADYNETLSIEFIGHEIELYHKNKEARDEKVELINDYFTLSRN